MGVGWILAVAMSGAVPADREFKDWFVDGDYRVLQVRRSDEEPWIRSSQQLAVTTPQLREHLLAFDRYPAVFSGDVKSVEILERKTQQARIHVVWAIPFPYSNRDAIVHYSWRDVTGGGFELSWEDDARDGDPKEGVRIEKVRGSTVLEPAGNNAVKVTYTYYGDLGGSFPDWIKDMAWKKEPRVYFEALRRATSPTELR